MSTHARPEEHAFSKADPTEATTNSAISCAAAPVCTNASWPRPGAFSTCAGRPWRLAYWRLVDRRLHSPVVGHDIVARDLTDPPKPARLRANKRGSGPDGSYPPAPST